MKPLKFILTALLVLITFISRANQDLIYRTYHSKNIQIDFSVNNSDEERKIQLLYLALELVNNQYFNDTAFFYIRIGIDNFYDYYGQQLLQTFSIGVNNHCFLYYYDAYLLYSNKTISNTITLYSHPTDIDIKECLNILLYAQMHIKQIKLKQTPYINYCAGCLYIGDENFNNLSIIALAISPLEIDKIRKHKSPIVEDIYNAALNKLKTYLK